MWIPKMFRRSPSFSDVAEHIRKMPPEQVQYMSMLTKSLDFGESFLDAVKTGNSGSVSSFLRLSANQQLETIKNVALVHACVTTVSSAFQEAPLAVEQRNSEGGWKKTPEVSHSMIKAFKNNPDLSESEIMMYLALNIELTGRSFLWLIRNGYGEIVEVFPLPSSWVTPVLSPDFENIDGGSRLFDGYRVSFNNSSTEATEGGQIVSTFYLPPEDVIYTKFPNPKNLVDGLSPLTACYPYVNMEAKGIDYTTNALESLNLPGMVIKTDRQMTDVQKKMLRSVLADKIGAKASQSALQFSGKDLTVDMINPLESFGWNEFYKLNESRICMAFKVPPIVIGAMIGLEETTGWASGDMREAKKWLYRNTVHGIWKMFATNFTRHFIPEDQRENFRIVFDSEQVPELQEERGKLEERAVSLFNSSMLTLNEAREMMLLKEIDGGDVFKTNLSNMYVPAEQLSLNTPLTVDNAPTATTPEEEIEEEPKNEEEA